MQGRVGRGPVAVMMRGGLVFMSAGGEVNCKKTVKAILCRIFFTLTESPWDFFLELKVEDLFVDRLRGVSFCSLGVRLKEKGVGALVVRLLNGLVPVH